METCRIAIPDRIEPAHRLHFGVARRRDQAIHHRFVCSRRLVLKERIHFFRCRRNPGKIERHPPNQRSFVRFRRRLKVVLPKPVLDEVIDWVANQVAADLRRFGPLDRFISPVPLIDRALGDPLPDQILLRLGQLFMSVFRRHQLGWIRRENPLNDCALLGLSRNDRRDTGLRGLHRLFAPVEPQTGHACLRIKPVAAKARIRHDRPNITVESDFGVGNKLSCQ